jgi:hypothetical protein
MEIKPAAGFTLVPLPNGKFAFVNVEIIGPKTAAKLARALTGKSENNNTGTSS